MGFFKNDKRNNSQVAGVIFNDTPPIIRARKSRVQKEDFECSSSVRQAIFSVENENKGSDVSLTKDTILPDNKQSTSNSGGSFFKVVPEDTVDTTIADSVDEDAFGVENTTFVQVDADNIDSPFTVQDSVSDDDEIVSWDESEEEQVTCALPEESEPYRERHNVLKFLKDAVTRYKKPIAVKDEVMFDSEDDIDLSIDADGFFVLPNVRVYDHDFPVPWDHNFEVRVPNGKTFSVDLGVTMRIPTGYAVEIIPTSELITKFGLEFPENHVLLYQKDLLTPVIVPVCACTNISYVARYKSIFKARLIKAG